MSAYRFKGTFVVLALLVAGSLMLSGCGAAAPASVAMAAAAVESAGTGTPVAVTTVPSTLPGAAGTPAAGSAITSTLPVANGAKGTITVVGQGQVKSKPDVAHSQIGIEVMAPTVAEAMKEAQTRMDAVLKALKAAGIADKDIQTSNFSINFERQNPGTPAVKGNATGTPEGVYRVNNMVAVTLRDLTKVGNVIDGAVTAGANNVYGINFGLDNTTTLESQAREKAVADARARAESLAKLNGVTLGGVVSVSEVIGTQGGPRYAMEAVGMGGGGGTPVESGEVNFSTQIQVVYAIQ